MLANNSDDCHHYSHVWDRRWWRKLRNWGDACETPMRKREGEGKLGVCNERVEVTTVAIETCSLRLCDLGVVTVICSLSDVCETSKDQEPSYVRRAIISKVASQWKLFS